MSCLGEFAVPLRASNAFNGAGRGGRLAGGDISRGRLGNAAGGSLPELQFLHKLLVLPRPFDSRVAPHGHRSWPCLGRPGQSPCSSFRRMRHALSGMTGAREAASAAPSINPLASFKNLVRKEWGTHRLCLIADVGSHYVAV